MPIALCLGLGALWYFLPSTLVSQLMLSSFRSCFGSHIVEITQVAPLSYLEDVIWNGKSPTVLALGLQLMALFRVGCEAFRWCSLTRRSRSPGRASAQYLLPECGCNVTSCSLLSHHASPTIMACISYNSKPKQACFPLSYFPQVLGHNKKSNQCKRKGLFWLTMASKQRGGYERQGEGMRNGGRVGHLETRQNFQKHHILNELCPRVRCCLLVPPLCLPIMPSNHDSIETLIHWLTTN